MKSPDEIKNDLVRQWLAKAEEDFAVAELILSEGSYFNAIAFHCQQAAEKYLKAYLIDKEIIFKKTHDIGVLLDLVEEIDKEMADRLQDSADLTDYGVDIRYPAELPELGPGGGKRAFGLATNVRNEVMRNLQSVL